MNRVMTFGILLFTFAMTILGYQVNPTDTSNFIVPLMPHEFYQITGIIAVVISVFFLVLAARKKWSEWGEKILSGGTLYPIWFILYFGLYIISFLKGLVGIVGAKQPSWIMYPVFFIGYAAIFYIFIIVLKYWPKKQREK